MLVSEMLRRQFNTWAVVMPLFLAAIDTSIVRFFKKAGLERADEALQYDNF